MHPLQATPGCMSPERPHTPKLIYMCTCTTCRHMRMYTYKTYIHVHVHVISTILPHTHTHTGSAGALSEVGASERPSWATSKQINTRFWLSRISSFLSLTSHSPLQLLIQFYINCVYPKIDLFVWPLIFISFLVTGPGGIGPHSLEHWVWVEAQIWGD